MALVFSFLFFLACGSLLAEDLQKLQKDLAAAKKSYQTLVNSGAPRAEIEKALKSYQDLQKRYQQLAAATSVSAPSTATVAPQPGRVGSGWQEFVVAHPFSDFTRLNPEVLLPLLTPQKVSFWQRVGSLFSANSASLFNKGLEALKGNDLQKAAQYLEKSLQKDPKNFEARVALAALYKKMDRPEASQLFAGLKTATPGQVPWLEQYRLYDEARQRSASNDPAAAIRLWEQLKEKGIAIEEAEQQLSTLRLLAAFTPGERDLFQKAVKEEQSGSKYKALQQFRALLKQAGKSDAKKAVSAKIAALEKLAEENFNQVLRARTDEYIQSGIKFKIGGYDTVEVYKEKLGKGNQTGLHGDEYFEKYVDPKTWQFRSAKAKAEFESIGGLDCAGFCQRSWQSMFEKAGVKYPVNTELKISGNQLMNQKFMEKFPLTKESVFPPPDMKPGDVIHLGAHGDGIWNHFFLFDHVDASGKVWIRDQNSNGPACRPMPDWYRPYLAGWARYKDRQKIQEVIGLQ